MSDAICIYHAGCMDGFCAAWLFHHIEPDAEFFPASYSQEPPDVKGKRIFMFDFSYKGPVIQKIIDDCRSLMILDHHETAQKELDPFIKAGGVIADKTIDIIFNMKKSGARLTWEMFANTLVKDHLFKDCDPDILPLLVRYTEDRDLWRWQLPMSKQINTALRSYPFDFDTWNGLEQALQAGAGGNDLVAEGAAIIKRNDQIIDTHVNFAKEIDFEGHKVLCVNCTVDVTSEVCEKLAENRLFGMSYFIRKDGMVIWSLRSRSDFKVNELAKKYGGGGHPRAAGFETDISFLKEILDVH